MTDQEKAQLHVIAKNISFVSSYSIGGAGIDDDTVRYAASQALLAAGYQITEARLQVILADVRLRVPSPTKAGKRSMADQELDELRASRVNVAFTEPEIKAVTERFLKTFPGLRAFAEKTRRTYQEHHAAAERAFSPTGRLNVDTRPALQNIPVPKSSVN